MKTQRIILTPESLAEIIIDYFTASLSNPNYFEGIEGKHFIKLEEKDTSYFAVFSYEKFGVHGKLKQEDIDKIFLATENNEFSIITNETNKTVFSINEYYMVFHINSEKIKNIITDYLQMELGEKQLKRLKLEYCYIDDLSETFHYHEKSENKLLHIIIDLEIDGTKNTHIFDSFSPIKIKKLLNKFLKTNTGDEVK